MGATSGDPDAEGAVTAGRAAEAAPGVAGEATIAGGVDGAGATGGLPDSPYRVGTSGSLSPSRATTFMQCPLLYRFRVIDKLPQKPSPAAAKGTLVHAVLERNFDLPAGGRTLTAAQELLPGAWETVRAKEPAIAELFADEHELTAWLEEARALVRRWFEVEDPTRLEPAHREILVETRLDGGLLLRGYIDRLDVAPDGRMRVVDYKTGKSPRPAYEAKALFQMRFYGLVLWRLRGRVPTLLQLVYLGDGRTLRYEPDEADLLALEATITGLWGEISEATRSGEWRPRRGPLCPWGDHQAICPAFGGTPPPLPVPVSLPGL